MAEVQSSVAAGENTARFVEFVMMQAQNASLFMGLMPTPGREQPEVNLDLARMFIDQLAMIQEKTRGNLNTEEANILRNALSNLQMAFYEVSQGGGKRSSSATEQAAPAPDPVESSSQPEIPTNPAPETATGAEGESKKRFTKSYGS